MNQTVDPKGDLLDETRAFWQARSPRQLSREDAREIIENPAKGVALEIPVVVATITALSAVVVGSW